MKNHVYLSIIFFLSALTIHAEYISDGELITDAMGYFSQNILTLSDEQIAEDIQEILEIAEKNSISKSTILQTLHDYFTELREYHKQNIGETKDYFARKVALTSFGISTTIYLITALSYNFLLKPVSQEIKEILDSQIVINQFQTTDGSTEFTVSHRIQNSAHFNDLKKDYVQYSVLTGVLALAGLAPLAIGSYEYYKYLYVDPRHADRYERLGSLLVCLQVAMQ